MEGKPASLYTRLGGYDAIAAVVDDLLHGCVPTNCSTDFGSARVAMIPITANANWLLILSLQPREGRRFTWAGA
jgi:hypothetical protein